MKKIGICACSDGQREEERKRFYELTEVLGQTGCEMEVSRCLFAGENAFSGSGRERAQELTRLFSDPKIEEIYDISGGDMANEVLDFLDYGKIAQSSATLWGYSDLTTVLNAVYTKTGKSGVLYQIKNLVGENGEEQRERYKNREELFRIARWREVGGRVCDSTDTTIEGVVVGGNIRCFLKLAGTPYFPELEDKILFLEALGGELPQLVTYLSQLRQLGAFSKVKGILLGTFTRYRTLPNVPDICDLVRDFAGDTLPILKTEEIGHGSDARAIRIGASQRFSF